VDLLMIRHAVAVPRGTPGVADDLRPLTPRGRARFRRAASGLARVVRAPDRLLTSPLLRAQQTARLAARAWGEVEPEILPGLASGRHDEVLAALRAHASADRVAVVGHEPHLSGLLARLLGTRSAARLTFKKGGVAVVRLAGPPDRGGDLVAFLPPRLLRRLAK
jgi:phosphohistidine phosphatase